MLYFLQVLFAFPPTKQYHISMALSRICDPRESRTPVSAVRGQRPKPLDDRANMGHYTMISGIFQGS